MKKLIFCLAAVLLLTTISPTQILAASRPDVLTTTNPTESAEVNALLKRLNEIKAMDMSTVSRAEKKELRKEVSSTKAALHASGHGVYISVGAIIIIILLIILLL